jgi:hypothetical protein
MAAGLLVETWNLDLANTEHVHYTLDRRVRVRLSRAAALFTHEHALRRSP